MRGLIVVVAVMLIVAACQQKAPAPAAETVQPAVAPPESKVVSEAPFTSTSAQGAADVVQTYFALVEEKRYDQAWKLWSDEGRAGAPTAQDFAAQFDAYADYHALVEAPGPIEGAAGSLYVTVPITAYGKLRSGGDFRRSGTVSLRRVNDVPGATPAQLAWHIAKIDLQPEG